MHYKVRFDNLRFSSKIQNLISNWFSLCLSLFIFVAVSVLASGCVHRTGNAFKRPIHRTIYIVRAAIERGQRTQRTERRMTHKSVTLREKRKIYWICRRFVCACERIRSAPSTQHRARTLMRRIYLHPPLNGSCCCCCCCLPLLL